MTVTTIDQHVAKINHYTTLAARQMREDGRQAGLLQLAGHPPLAFVRNYLAHGGIRDGIPGFVISAMNAYYVFLKFAKLWELDRVQSSEFRVQGSFEDEGHVRTPNPEPQTPNAKRRTPNPEPRTRNPEPERTLNPEP